MYSHLFIFSIIIYSSIQLVYNSIVPSSLDFEARIKYGSQALNALEHLLNFFESDANHLNLDGVYGLRIAQGQLNALNELLTSKSNEKHSITDKNQHIQKLSQQIERIANKSLMEIAQQTSIYLKQFRLIIDQPFHIEYELRKLKQNLIEHGERSSDFNEDESDECFSQLLGTTNTKKCFIKQSCWSMMTTKLTKDYRITHQLLWFLVAKSIGCLDNHSISNLANKNFKYLEDRYCSNIYYDAQININDNDNQDLFLEELLLCSIIGYEEFLRLDWLKRILTWQHPQYGCFTNDVDFKIKRRHLLVEQEMNNGCLSHKSGLASGLLATYVRVFLQ